MKLWIHLAIFITPLVAAGGAWAIVEKLTSLEQIVRDSQVIVVAKVTRIDEENLRVSLNVEETLKGEPVVQRVAIDLRSEGADASRKPADLLERIEPDSRVVLFLSEVGPEQLIFAYARGTWFHFSGPLESGVVKARFESAEPFLRKTYRGEVDALARLLRDYASQSASLPAADPKVKAGLGPRIGEAESPDADAAAPVPSFANGQFELPSANGFQPHIPLPILWSLLGIAGAGLLVMLTRRTPIESSHD